MGNDKLGSIIMEEKMVGDHRRSVVQRWHAILKTACKMNEIVQDYSFGITVSCLIFEYRNSGQAC